MKPDSPEAVYQYNDERGQLLYEVVRFPEKRFVTRRPDGKSGWIWNLDGVQRVVYRLEEVALVEQVILVEGEKDVESLRRLDLVATTNPNGTNGWRPEFARFFRGKHVIILPDQDATGQAWAERVLNDLHGIVASIKRIDLPDLEPGSGADITDWLRAGHTKKELLALLEDAPEWREIPKLPGEIDSIRRSANAPPFEKKRNIAEAVRDDLSQHGQFYRTQDRRAYYFENTEHRLYRVDFDEFVRLLAETSGLNPTENEFKYVNEDIKTHVLRRGVEAQVYQFGHFDRVA